MSSEVQNSRTINFPRELVWRAWEEPEHLTKWFGPNGFNSTFHEFDFREGGDWKFIFHGPDGKNYKNHSNFKEIKKPERVVYDHLSPPEYQGTMTLEDCENGKTKVSFTQKFPKPIEEKFRTFLNEKNEENLDRLETELSQMKAQ